MGECGNDEKEGEELRRVSGLPCMEDIFIYGMEETGKYKCCHLR